MTAGKRSSRRIHEGKLVDLDIDTVELPNGKVTEFEILRHPGAAAVVPFLSDPAGSDPQILMLRQYRYAADGYIYEIPAGKLDGSEDPAVCARRELEEETGCTAGKIDRMTTIFTTPGFTDEQIHLFMASDLTRGDSSHESDEFISEETMPISRVLGMIERGEISDAKTICAILYAAGFRLR
jgi:ADP-ribose pyrophosphatase